MGDRDAEVVIDGEALVEVVSTCVVVDEARALELVERIIFDVVEVDDELEIDPQLKQSILNHSYTFPELRSKLLVVSA
jgi:hypothetical protein